MTKEALGWVCGLRSNDLLMMWENSSGDLLERFGEWNSRMTWDGYHV